MWLPTPTFSSKPWSTEKLPLPSNGRRATRYRIEFIGRIVAGRSSTLSTFTMIGGNHRRSNLRFSVGIVVPSTSLQGPLLNPCQCARRIWGRGAAWEPSSSESTLDCARRMAVPRRTPTSHTVCLSGLNNRGPFFVFLGFGFIGRRLSPPISEFWEQR